MYSHTSLRPIDCRAYINSLCRYIRSRCICSVKLFSRTLNCFIVWMFGGSFFLSVTIGSHCVRPYANLYQGISLLHRVDLANANDYFMIKLEKRWAEHVVNIYELAGFVFHPLINTIETYREWKRINSKEREHRVNYIDCGKQFYVCFML